MDERKHPAVAVLEQLIRIPSVNPAYGAEATGETALADYLERRLSAAGLKVSRQSVLPGRDNVIAELRTGHPERTLLLESHMDTVSPGGMTDPFEPRLDGTRLYGRGACDTKATLAGMVYAIEQCAREADAMACDVVLCAAADEEHRYRGVLAFLDSGMQAHGAVVGEPTGLRLVVAAKGCVRFALTTIGRSAHSSVPSEGDNAIYQMMKVVRYIRETEEPRLAAMSDPLCGSPTISAGTILGGSQVNIVADTCTIEVDRRIVPGERPEEVAARFEAELRDYAESEGIRFRMETLLIDWPLHTSPGSAIVQTARTVLRDCGRSDACIGVPYGCDASKLQQLGGIPTFVFGPGSIEQAHSDAEWVDVRDVELAAEFYRRLAKAYGT